MGLDFHQWMMRRRSGRSPDLAPFLFAVLALSLVLPVFINVDVSHRSVGLGTKYHSYQGFNFAIIAIIAPLLLLLALHRWRRVSVTIWPGDATLLWFLVVNACSLTIGCLWLAAHGSPREIAISMLYFIQLVLPLSGFYLVRILFQSWSLEERIRKLGALLLISSSVASISVLVLVLETVWLSGPHALLDTGIRDHVGPIYVTGILRYYPTILAASATVLLAFFMFNPSAGRWGYVAGPLGAAGAIATFFVWSRSAIVLLGITLAILLVSAFVFVPRQDFPRKRLAAMATLGGIAFAFLLVVNPIAFERLVNGIVGIGSASASNDARVADAVLGLRYGVLQPLGTMYIPMMHQTWSGVPYDFPRILVTDNNYLDYAVLAGPLAMGLFCLFLFNVVRGALHNIRALQADTHYRPNSRLWVLLATFSVLLGVASWSNFTQYNFVQPYTAFFFWALCGATVSILVEFRLDPSRCPGNDTTRAQASPSERGSPRSAT